MNDFRIRLARVKQLGTGREIVLDTMSGIEEP
jgi:hypothetical protein